jgi:hypothetical protein
MYKRELGDRGRPQFKSNTCESNTATAEKQKINLPTIQPTFQNRSFSEGDP